MMRITILGTGGALPPGGRAQSGIFIESAAGCLLLDCGSGVLLRLAQAEIDLARLNTILLTHLHLDHMSDLLPLLTARWLNGQVQTRLYGPKGTEALLQDLMAHYDYVQEHVRLSITELAGGMAIEAQGFQIECLKVEHGTPALAYKFDRRFVFSGDTVPLSQMSRFAGGCKLLLHECSLPDGVEAPHHSRPRELGEALANCDAAKLVLTHLYPPTRGREVEMIRSVKQHFAGQVELAEDLARYEL